MQAGSDPNAKDVDEWTPLHAAAHWGQKEACKLLADYGADFTLRNHVVCICDSLSTFSILGIFDLGSGSKGRLLQFLAQFSSDVC